MHSDPGFSEELDAVDHLKDVNCFSADDPSLEDLVRPSLGSRFGHARDVLKFFENLRKNILVNNTYDLVKTEFLRDDIIYNRDGSCGVRYKYTASDNLIIFKRNRDSILQQCNDHLNLLDSNHPKYTRYAELVGEVRAHLNHIGMMDPLERKNRHANLINEELSPICEILNSATPITQRLLKAANANTRLHRIITSLCRDDMTKGEELSEDHIARNLFLVCRQVALFFVDMAEIFDRPDVSQKFRASSEAIGSYASFLARGGIPKSITTQKPMSVEELMARFDIEKFVEVNDNEYRYQFVYDRRELWQSFDSNPGVSKDEEKLLCDMVEYGMCDRAFHPTIKSRLESANKIPKLPEKCFYGRDGYIYRIFQSEIWESVHAHPDTSTRAKSSADSWGSSSLPRQRTDEHLVRSYSQYPYEIFQVLKAEHSEFKKLVGRDVVWRKDQLANLGKQRDNAILASIYLSAATMMYLLFNGHNVASVGGVQTTLILAGIIVVPAGLYAYGVQNYLKKHSISVREYVDLDPYPKKQ